LGAAKIAGDGQKRGNTSSNTSSERSQVLLTPAHLPSAAGSFLEGRISFPVTVRDKDGSYITKTIVKNGPTNLIITTTATSLHGENETRLISLPTNDTREQTQAIFMQLADGKPAAIDFGEWHALQEWLQGAEHRVSIPTPATWPRTSLR
jgi:hypothetical protein